MHAGVSVFLLLVIKLWIAQFGPTAVGKSILASLDEEELDTCKHSEKFNDIW